MKRTSRTRCLAVVGLTAAAFIAVILGAGGMALGVTDSWTNAGGGNWSDSSNWNPRLPGSGAGVNDDAQNLLSNAPISFNTNATINSFFSQSSNLNVVGGTLAGSQANSASAVQVNGALAVNGGALFNLTIAQGVGGSVTFANNGGDVFNQVIAAADLTFNNGDYLLLFNANSAHNITMASTGNGIQFNDSNAQLALTGTLHGFGATFNNGGGGTLVDNGTISADSAGNTLAINNTNLTGGGVLEAKNGGILSIAAVINGSGLQVHVDNNANSVALINGGGVTGTLGASTGTGLSFANNGNNFISAATIAGDLTFGQGGYSRLYNANSVSGNINMASTNNGIQFNDSNAQLTLTGTLHGYGATFNNGGGGTLIDNGTISADSAGNTLAINNTNLTGSGILEAKNGGILSIGAVINGSGLQVHVDNNPNSVALINGGGVTGALGASTGAGLSFANNGNNFISAATIAGDLTFGQGGYSRLYNANSISGNINMASTGNGIQFNDSNAQLTLTGTLHGYGATFNNGGGGTLIDNGTISADSAGNTLAINNTNLTGNGVLEAKNGGVLSIGAIINGNGLQVHVDNNANSVALINGGGVTGTLGASTGTGLSFANNGNNFISGATIAGDLTFGQGGYSRLYNANSISGNINMASTGNGIQFNDSNAQLTLTGTLHGFGFTTNNGGGGTLINNGIVAGDVIGQTLYLRNTNLTGNGVFEGINGGTLSIGGRLNGNNAVAHADSGTLLVDGGGLTGTFAAATGAGFSFANNGNNFLIDATINGNLTFAGGAYALLYNANSVNGSINMTGTSNGIQFNDSNASLTLGPPGKLHGYGATFNNGGGGRLINNGAIVADTSGTTLALNNSIITNNASVIVVSGATLSVGGVIKQNAGETKVDGSLSLAGTYQINGGILSGTGTISGNIDNMSGTERAGDSPGILTIAGSYAQEHGATFEELIGGSALGAGYSQLTVTALATLDGTLDVSLINGFKPTVGETFDVLLGANTGSFPFTTTPDPGFTYSVFYLSDRVRITVDTLPVPEPSSLVLLGLGGLVMLRWRRGLKSI